MIRLHQVHSFQFHMTGTIVEELEAKLIKPETRLMLDAGIIRINHHHANNVNPKLSELDRGEIELIDFGMKNKDTIFTLLTDDHDAAAVIPNMGSAASNIIEVMDISLFLVLCHNQGVLTRDQVESAFARLKKSGYDTPMPVSEFIGMLK
ncbi:MAG: hypothetical protein MPJ05_00790 [Nitrosopumilus sp.]|nr:hypothetical protein [Nitrosopumilus sp.]MDA7998236.1 hypothetical protein [Nitrosopumilus sp.]MDA7998659.1 hypothetical protein [Nitrosopumilus sp.]